MTIAQEIARLNAEGLTDREIADKLGISAVYAGDIRRRAGLPRNPAPCNRTPQLAPALYAQGMTDQEIADKIGVCRDTVAKWRRSENLPPNGLQKQEKPKPAPSRLKSCKGCVYSSMLNGDGYSQVYCNYYVATGHRRPVKPPETGKRCELYQTGKRKGWHTYGR